MAVLKENQGTDFWVYAICNVSRMQQEMFVPAISEHLAQ
jgi:hypothetical protein